jgi:hypothetical protein
MITSIRRSIKGLASCERSSLPCRDVTENEESFLPTDAESDRRIDARNPCHRLTSGDNLIKHFTAVS